MINRKNTLTSLNHWFPIVSRLGIPVPRTLIIDVNRETFINSVGGLDRVDPELLKILQIQGQKLGYPVFMRTDLCAGKHDWKNTCFVPDERAFESHVIALAEFNELVDIMGLPYKSLVLREFLDLEIAFTAFPGKMPINRERRYFVDGGKLICHHPYWPPEAFETDNGRWAPVGWQTELDKLNKEEPEEIGQLTQWAEKVGRALGDFWSVDFAKTKNNGWYLIDMAVGEASYHWEGCPNEHRRIRGV